MKNEGAGVGELIDRYVYQVVKRLPVSQREDIEQELRGLIDDMLAARSENPTREDAMAVLKELGTPFELAAKYRGTGRYLIGPDYYAIYELVVKIAVGATALGMAIAQIVGNITTPTESIIAAIAEFFGSIFMGAVQAFAWVTVVFALLERFAKGKPHKDADWNPADLPPVPEQRAVIKRSEPIVSIAFAALWISLIVSVPELFAVYFDGGSVPVFNLAGLHTLMPLVVLIAGLGIVKELLRLIEGRYTLRLAIATAVINVAALVLFIGVYGGTAIWNADLITSLGAVWGENMVLVNIWRIFPKILAGIAAFGFVVETITAFVRSLQR